MTFAFRSIYSQPSQRALNAVLDQFAELLSRDLPLPEIARLMDMTTGSACAYLRMLTDKYGWQAA